MTGLLLSKTRAVLGHIEPHQRPEHKKSSGRFVFFQGLIIFDFHIKAPTRVRIGKMKTDDLFLGLGMAALGLVMTFAMPVAARRVNQGLISAIIIIAFIIAALALFPLPTALFVMAGAIIFALLYRDVVRFIKHTVYGVTKYSRRDWWYRRIGQMMMGGRRR